jgi:serine/threonine-protein kinase HipA
MDIGSAGRYANRNNLISKIEHFLLSKEEGTLIIDTMAEQVKNTWQQVFLEYGVSQHDCRVVSSAFVYEGFFYDLPEY